MRRAGSGRGLAAARSGRERTVSEVYGVLSSRYASAARSSLPGTMVASANMVAAVPAAAAPVDNAAYLSSFPDVRATKPVAVSQPAQDLSFRTLFQAGDRAQPVSPTVQQLWANGQSQSASVDALRATPEVRAPRPFDLFSDRAGVFSG